MQASKSLATALLCISVIFLFADQNLIAPNMTAIANEFDFNEHQKDQYLGANIALGFFVVGGIVSVVAGVLADTTNRVDLYTATVICGECACLGTYFTHTYTQLLISRVMAGIGVGGAAPILFSILADFYPNTSRVYMSTLIGISMSTGISLGQFVAGMVGPVYGWRLPFLLVATPALVNAMLIYGIVTEPERGGQEHALLIVREQRVEYQQQQEQSTCSYVIPTIGSENIGISKEGMSADVDMEKGDYKAQQQQQQQFHQPRPFHQQYGSLSTDSSEPIEFPPAIARTPTPAAAMPTAAATVTKPTAPTKQTISAAPQAQSYKNQPKAYTAVSTVDLLLAASETETEFAQLGAGAPHAAASASAATEDVPAQYRETITWSKVKQLIHTPSVVLIYLQGIPGCIPWGMIYVYLNDYLSYNHHLSVATATMCMTIFGLGSIIGQILGGWIGQKLYNAGRRADQCTFMGVSCIVGALPLIYVLQHKPGTSASSSTDGSGSVDMSTDILGFCLLMFITGLAVSIPGPNVRSILQNVCPPETRGTAFALFNLTDDIGKGGGPVLVALMVRGLGGRENAFIVSASLWLLCGAIQCYMAVTVVADEEAVQHHVLQSIYNSQQRQRSSSSQMATFTTTATGRTGATISTKSNSGIASSYSVSNPLHLIHTPGLEPNEHSIIGSEAIDTSTRDNSREDTGARRNYYAPINSQTTSASPSPSSSSITESFHAMSETEAVLQHSQQQQTKNSTYAHTDIPLIVPLRGHREVINEGTEGNNTEEEDNEEEHRDSFSV